jgi:hypothetical protein
MEISDAEASPAPFLNQACAIGAMREVAPVSSIAIFRREQEMQEVTPRSMYGQHKTSENSALGASRRFAVLQRSDRLCERGFVHPTARGLVARHERSDMREQCPRHPACRKRSCGLQFLLTRYAF